jgi:cytochrome c-type biogenesis protein CcmH
VSRALVAVLAVLGLLSATGAVEGQQPAVPVSDREAYEIASQLRCVVCQNLSVADSPSEMAQQMREIVRQRLAAGERPAEVVQYFVDRYGEWILLAPPRRGFNLLVWGVPFVAVAVGLVTVGVLLRRWTRPAAGAPRGPEPPLDPALRERIRRELEAEQP